MKVRDKGVYYNIVGKNMINGLYGSFALDDEDATYIVCMNESEFNTYCSKMDVLSFKAVGNSYIIKISKNSRSKKFLDKTDR